MAARRGSSPSGSVAEPRADASASRIVVDSGPFIALFDGRDRWHPTVREWLRNHPEAVLVSTWPVLTEVCTLLARRVRNEAALDFLRWVHRGAVTLDVPDAGSLREALRTSERFADLPFDLADASVAEAASRLRIRSVLSIDRDFGVYRDREGARLSNPLLDG